MLYFQCDGQELAASTLKLRLRFCTMLVTVALTCQVWFEGAALWLELSSELTFVKVSAPSILHFC